MLSSLLAVWPFAQSWMLAWGLAATIPIVIHLWSKRRYHEVTWAAIDFLLAALKKNARRIRVEQWLLLAIRTLILLLLALALADPRALFSALTGRVGGESHLVLVLDASYSMAFQRSEQQTRFDLARELASQWVRQTTQGDGFTLVLLADPPRVVIGEPAFDAADVLDELAGLKLLHGGANLPATLAEVQRIVDRAAQKTPRLTQTRVGLFTDLGRNTWDDVSAPELRSGLARLSDRAQLVLFDVGQPDSPNAAVTRLEAREPLATIAREQTYDLEVRNFGQQRRSPEVTLFVDGQRVGEQRLEIGPGDSATASFVHRFDAPGEHRVEARLDGDALPLDDRRWLAVPVLEAIRVLCIEGQPGESRFVTLALEPTRSPTPRVRADVRLENALRELDLRTYDCLLLCNVDRFGRDDANVLHDYLKSGGGLIFFLGDRVQAENYNEELGAAGRRVLPARIESLVTDPQYGFDPLEFRHPIVRPFAGHREAGLQTTPVWRHFRLVPASDAAKVALAFSGGPAFPALVEEPILRGRSLLWATAVSDLSLDRTATPPQAWTAFPTWPSFPPLIQEMFALAIRGRVAQRNVTVGEALQGLLPEMADQAVAIVTPDGATERVRPTSDGDDHRWAFDTTQISGPYEVRFGTAGGTSQFFAANLDPRESDLDRIDLELLPGQFRQDYKADDPRPSLPPTQPSRYFRHILFGVLALLLGETVLAWRFGNRA